MGERETGQVRGLVRRGAKAQSRASPLLSKESGIISGSFLCVLGGQGGAGIAANRKEEEKTSPNIFTEET